jgi:hypothetical protein
MLGQVTEADHPALPCRPQSNRRDCFPAAGPSLSWSNQQAFVATPLLLLWVEMFRELN